MNDSDNNTPEPEPAATTIGKYERNVLYGLTAALLLAAALIAIGGTQTPAQPHTEPQRTHTTHDGAWDVTQ